MSTGHLRLHLGCGSHVVSGWENLDKSPTMVAARIPGARALLRRLRVLTDEQATAAFPAGIKRVDIRNGIPYPDGSAAHVYSSHMIEHLSRWQAADLLKECHRVLAPGGILRLATPDLQMLVDHYVREKEQGDPRAADHFMEGMLTFVEQPGSVVQRLGRRLLTAPHQWVYDVASLAALIEECGFVSVGARGFREGVTPDLDELEHYDAGQFIEAVRP